jgi:hypothetical protein
MINPRRVQINGRKDSAGALEVDRGDAAFALLEGEANPLTLVQLAQAGALDGADMDKNIVTAGFGGDEAIAFAGVEPFHDASECYGLFLIRRIVFLQLCRFHLKHLCSALIVWAWDDSSDRRQAPISKH